MCILLWLHSIYIYIDLKVTGIIMEKVLVAAIFIFIFFFFLERECSVDKIQGIVLCCTLAVC